ncbi:MAG: plastocyanin/azurin family copper-binding protein [Solirubrobacterales bacterium]
MRRALTAIAVLIVTCSVAFALPAGSGASAQAQAASKCKRKHKHHHRRKRCRKSSSSTGTGDAGGGTTSGPPGRLLATEREVSATQLQLQLSRATLPAGTTIVEQYNAGQDAHNLVLETNSAAAFAFDTLAPGGDQRQTLTLAKGTWTLYCSLLDHRNLGMQATLTVN